MIIAVDFDGTLCQDKFPDIGEEIPFGISAVKAAQANGNKVILWTCRNGAALEAALAWCEERGLHFDAVNENLPEVQARWGGDTRKVWCDYYIDDKNLTFVQLAERLLAE